MNDRGERDGLTGHPESASVQQTYDTFDPARWATVGLGLEGGRWGPEKVPERLDGIGVPRDEIERVYLPLARVLVSLAEARSCRPTGAEDGHPSGPGRPGPGRRPLVLGIAGGVAVGKSTTARVLGALLEGGPASPMVAVVSADSFLYPNRLLGERGMLDKKGYPETYDLGSMVAAISAVRAGRRRVAVPVYSHEEYDIVPRARSIVDRPDILIVEGLVVLQDAPGGCGTRAPSVRDLLDASVYIDASEADAFGWFRSRLADLRSDRDRRGAFATWLASLSDDEVASIAEAAWTGINRVNLVEHVAPTRSRALVILEKDRHQRVVRVLCRRP
ncbi:MAG: type I pantothenate kinase [Acidimicrobiales bacterium]